MGNNRFDSTPRARSSHQTTGAWLGIALTTFTIVVPLVGSVGCLSGLAMISVAALALAGTKELPSSAYDLGAILALGLLAFVIVRARKAGLAAVAAGSARWPAARKSLLTSGLVLLGVNIILLPAGNLRGAMGAFYVAVVLGGTGYGLALVAWIAVISVRGFVRIAVAQARVSAARANFVAAVGLGVPLVLVPSSAAAFFAVLLAAVVSVAEQGKLGPGDGSKLIGGGSGPGDCMTVLTTPPPDPRGKVSETIRRLGGTAHAADIAHETLLSVCETRPELASDPDHLYAYYAASVRNNAVDFWRKSIRSCSSLYDPETIRCDRPGADDEAISKQQEAVLRKALCRLSESERTLVHDCASLSLSRVATRHGFSKTTAKRRCDAVLDRLREITAQICGVAW